MQARLSASDSKIAVLEARISFKENVMEELKKENKQKLNVLTVLEARMSASENLTEELKRENTDLLARITTSENKSTVLEARMSSSENKVEELKKENAERPKVAFSFGLTDAGRIGPFNTDITLKFSRVFTNFGQAYNPTTGMFTAPVRGAYYFRFSAWDDRSSSSIGANLYHNGKRVSWNSAYNTDPSYITITNALVLQLEKGDVVYMVLPSNHGIWDDIHNRTTFSGFLLFSL
ncbi:cerebellin 17 isoform X1 [Lates calcarifer]|uniref:Cerebellin 17 isoform X1 n=1 Tax=Lates calcarifer TaxID=8187 RepID=A0AAJ7Q797_LATCA|nr:cerebellin 17 isoform X1 [Lates calcarifer]